MRGLLPNDAQALLRNIKQPEVAIGDLVEQLLLKLWNQEPLTPSELAMDITPAEVAAVWSITHRRPISSDTARQVLRRTGARGGQVKPSREWGSGPSLRRMYCLGDIISVKLQQTRASKP